MRKGERRGPAPTVPPTRRMPRPLVLRSTNSGTRTCFRIFKQAGIPRRTPPLRDPRCGIDVAAGRGNPPQITSPTGGIAYALRAFRNDEKAIPFQATTDADARDVFWFVNETYVGKAPSGKVFLWPAQPGSFVVRAVDDRGRSGSRDIAVTVVW